MKNLILPVALVAALLVSLPANAMDEIHVVKIRGTDYAVTELVKVEERWIPFTKPRWREYKILDNPNTLKVYKPEYLDNTEILKAVPDHRPFNEKHPKAIFMMNTLNLTWSVVSSFF